jgi:SOS-response transcriptional repressor LexA
MLTNDKVGTPRRNVLERIEHALGMRAGALLAMAGYAPAATSTVFPSSAIGEGRLIKVPILGCVRAGDTADPAPAEILGWELLDEALLSSGYYYFVYAEGNSLAGEARPISDGDLCLIRRQDYVETGRIHLVTIRGAGCTLKRVRAQDGRYELYSRTWGPERVDEVDLTIHGVLVKSIAYHEERVEV